MPIIETIQPEDATGELKKIYDDLIQSRGKIAEVHKIQSLNPKSIVNHMDLYMTLMYGKSPLKRELREMIAVVVSKANQCEYCQVHHLEALNHYWKDNEKAEKFRADFNAIELNPREKAYCEYAHQHTLTPGKSTTKIIEQLKLLGESDRAILDATMIIGYFNFVNRIVAGLQIQLETEGAGGYKFD
ncbi:MAG: peroxidase-related enzyme [Crocinitomicaceae bacterium]